MFIKWGGLGTVKERMKKNTMKTTYVLSFLTCKMGVIDVRVLSHLLLKVGVQPAVTVPRLPQKSTKANLYCAENDVTINNCTVL